MHLTPFLEVKIGNKFELGGLEDQAIKPMEEVTVCNIPRLSSVHHEANLDDCLKVIYSCWEGKQPLECYVQSRNYLATVPKGFSCPPILLDVSMGGFPYKENASESPPSFSSFYHLGYLSGVFSPQWPSIGSWGPRANNTSLHCLPGSYFPMALMRQPVPTQLLTACVPGYPFLPQCRGLHTNNLLNLGPIEGDSSPMCNQSCSFSIMPLAAQFWCAGF